MRIAYDQYYNNALSLNEVELGLQAELLPKLPDHLVDVHVHAAAHEHFEPDLVPPHIHAHMMSTFPVTTIERSQEIDHTLLPGIDIQKLRFSHVFQGIGHRAVNSYLLESSPKGDRVALFGVSNNLDDIAYTKNEIRTGHYAALKMYYNSSSLPKSVLFDYFPPEILEVAEAEKIPIILHLPRSLYNSRAEVEELVEKYPNLTVILAHIGVAHIVRPELDGILQTFSRTGNVYVDTSGVDNSELVHKALTTLGYDHVLYGSDEPLNLIRAVVYDNPELGPRLLTDYPYHWANTAEQAQWMHLAEGRFVHNEWRQLQAIVNAVDKLNEPPANRAKILEGIFYGNAQQLLGFGS